MINNEPGSKYLAKIPNAAMNIIDIKEKHQAFECSPSSNREKKLIIFWNVVC